MLETTTLSDGQQTFIPGIKQMESMAFTLNWDKELATKVSIFSAPPKPNPFVMKSIFLKLLFIVLYHS